MTNVIIDTNVLVVANGQNANVTQECKDACSEFLYKHDESILLLDTDDEIRSEYVRNLSKKRPYEVGIQFYAKHLKEGLIAYHDLHKEGVS
jgi:hypothetical protein